MAEEEQWKRSEDRPVLHVGRLAEGDYQLLVYESTSGMRCESSGIYGACYDLDRYRYGVSGYEYMVGEMGHVEVEVPEGTSVVTISVDGGQLQWQRPVAGWAIFAAKMGDFVEFDVAAYDAAGELIGRWDELSFTPALLAFYRSTFRSYERVEEGHIRPTGDGNVPRRGLSPMQPEQIKGVGEDGQDVCGSVGEHVPRVLVASWAGCQVSCYLVDVSIAVGMDQATDECLSLSTHDGFLPWNEFDLALVLAPRPMLREQTRPVLPVGIDLYTAHFRSEAHSLRSTGDHNGTRNFVDDVRVLQVAHDS
jgi:hypothetical protein